MGGVLKRMALVMLEEIREWCARQYASGALFLKLFPKTHNEMNIEQS